MPSTDVIIVGVAALFGLVVLGTGLSITSIGVERVRTARTLREAGPTALGDVPEARGLVKFEGVARELDGETLEAPVSDATCLAYTVRARTRDDAGRAAETRSDEPTDAVGSDEGDDAWRFDGGVSASVPFAVEDGIDRVTVDPANAVLSLDGWWTTQTAWTDDSDLAADALDRLEAAGRSEPDDDITDSSASGYRQYREQRLESGDDVHVFGASVARAGARGGGSDDPVTVVGDDWFEISISDEPSVIPERYRSGSLYVIFGGLIAVPGIGFTLAGVVGLISTLLL
ncbi:hypothetical protein [Natronorubrum halophilum]|uniref:hypothetical protein n=1 Tax=Natronorubrum halophilum TaxID=1702106 RepID=UPI000EF6EBB8|nr:hypothetical protein [Natronorubrum halophilum]